MEIILLFGQLNGKICNVSIEERYVPVPMWGRTALNLTANRKPFSRLYIIYECLEDDLICKISTQIISHGIFPTNTSRLSCSGIVIIMLQNDKRLSKIVLLI